MITLQSAQEHISNYYCDFKKFSDENDFSPTPMMMFFNSTSEFPTAIVHLPELDDDQADKMVKHKLATMFAPFLDTDIVSIATDVFFLKGDKDDKDKILNEGIKPSESIERQEGVTIFTVKADGKGLFSLKEYGRDDIGKIYFKEQTTSEVDDVSSGDELQSWISPVIMSSFTDQERIDELLDDKSDELRLLMTGIIKLDEIGYMVQISDAGMRLLQDKYQSIDEDTWQTFINGFDSPDDMPESFKFLREKRDEEE